MISITQVNVRWEGISGATSYEVKKDGVVVGTRGAKARTTSINVDNDTLIEIIDLPARSKPQGISFKQV